MGKFIIGLLEKLSKINVELLQSENSRLQGENVKLSILLKEVNQQLNSTERKLEQLQEKYDQIDPEKLMMELEQLKVQTFSDRENELNQWQQSLEKREEVLNHKENELYRNHCEQQSVLLAASQQLQELQQQLAEIQFSPDTNLTDADPVSSPEIAQIPEDTENTSENCSSDLNNTIQTNEAHEAELPLPSAEPSSDINQPEIIVPQETGTGQNSECNALPDEVLCIDDTEDKEEACTLTDSAMELQDENNFIETEPEEDTEQAETATQQDNTPTETLPSDVDGEIMPNEEEEEVPTEETEEASIQIQLDRENFTEEENEKEEVPAEETEEASIQIQLDEENTTDEENVKEEVPAEETEEANIQIQLDGENFADEENEKEEVPAEETEEASIQIQLDGENTTGEINEKEKVPAEETEETTIQIQLDGESMPNEEEEKTLSEEAEDEVISETDKAITPLDQPKVWDMTVLNQEDEITPVEDSPENSPMTSTEVLNQAIPTTTIEFDLLEDDDSTEQDKESHPNTIVEPSANSTSSVDTASEEETGNMVEDRQVPEYTDKSDQTPDREESAESAADTAVAVMPAEVPLAEDSIKIATEAPVIACQDDSNNETETSTPDTATRKASAKGNRKSAKQKESHLLPLDTINDVRAQFPYVRVTLATYSQCFFASEEVKLMVGLFETGINGRELISDRTVYIEESKIIGIEGMNTPFCDEEIICDFNDEEISEHAAQILLTAICTGQPLHATYDDKNGHITDRNMYYICFKPKEKRYTLPYKNLFTDIFNDEEEFDTDNIAAMTQKQSDPKVFSVSNILTLRPYNAFFATPQSIRDIKDGIKIAKKNKQTEFAKFIKAEIMKKVPEMPQKVLGR